LVEGGVTTVGVVPPLDEGEDRSASFSTGAEGRAIVRLALAGGEDALAERVVVAGADRPIEGRTFISVQRLPEVIEVYWQPWSEWWMTLLGRRCSRAMVSALITSWVRRLSAMLQPTTRLLHASTTTARQRNAAQVGT